MKQNRRTVYEQRRGIPVDMDVSCDCSFLSQPYVYIID